jgi:phage-related protein
MSEILPYQTKLSLNTSYSSEPRHRLVEFGDGYIQRSSWGPYAGRRQLNVIHEHLTQIEAADLIDFYEDRHADGESISISWNMLLDLSGTYYLESYDVEMTSDEFRTISASMKEVFGE